jgi:hypothetical protein
VDYFHNREITPLEKLEIRANIAVQTCYHGDKKINFDEMMMLFGLLRQISFIVLGH